MPYLYVETARERLCRGSRLMLGGLCNGTLVPSALRAVKEKPHQQTVKIIFPEQSTDAVIYVTVVVIFYAAIILILVGTNMHRFRGYSCNNRSPPYGASPSKQQVVVRLDHNDKPYQLSATPEDIKTEAENPENDSVLV